MGAFRTFVQFSASFYLVSMMLSLGLGVGAEPTESKELKRRKRRLLVVGIIFNLLIIPAAAFALTRALHTSSSVATALLLLVAAPGGRYAPHLVQLGKGDVALGVELTLFLAKLTGFTAAPLAKFMLHLDALELRELPLVAQLLVLQLLPFYAGKWLGRKGLASERLRIGLNRFSILLALLAAFFVLLQDRGAGAEFHERGWLAVAAVAIVSPLLGWLLGGHDDGACRTFAVGANASELGLALLMASLVFPVPGVHTALFLIWTLRSLASLCLAAALRRPKGLPYGVRNRQGRASATMRGTS
jgi:BASS family bile acid:Na+ symporter